MTISGLSKRLIFPLMLGVLSLSLVGCVARLGTGWAGLTVLDDGTHIAVAYEDMLAIIDIVDGTPISVVDSEGMPVIDDNGEAVLWQVKGSDLDNAKFFAAPLQYDDETLMAITQDRRLLRFDIVSGAALNPETEPIEGRGFAVTDLSRSNGLIFIGEHEKLIALDDERFLPQWSVGTEHAVWSEPLVLDDTMYFASLDHKLYAVNVESGDVNWKLDLGGASAGTPVYSESLERLYLGTFNRQILAISLDGEIVEEYATDEWVWGDVSLVDDRLYFADLGGTVYNLNAETLSDGDGWKVKIGAGAIRTTPIVLEDTVVVASRDEHIYWIAKDSGSEVFNRQLDGEVLSDLFFFSADEELGIEEDMIVVSTMSNREILVAFTAGNGERLWTFRR